VRIDAAVGAARILFRGRLHEIPEGFLMMAPTKLGPLLRSSLFSAPAKLRMALERFIPPSSGGVDESLASFVTRRFGREALERVAEPVLASLFMADAEKLSMAAALPRFVEMEQAAGSVTRGGAGGAGVRASGRFTVSFARGRITTNVDIGRGRCSKAA
jgi:oxygen-dependent protoporphyrinogen oxidase